jgi:hypothetical protein
MVPNSPFHSALLQRLDTIGSMGDYVPMPKIQPTQQPVAGQNPGYTLPGGQYNDPLEFGRWLQKRGFRVSEHPAFGGVDPVHTKNSKHYSKRAFDVNYGPGGTSRQETAAINGILAMAQKYGLKYIWQAPGHYNHAHFSW